MANKVYIVTGSTGIAAETIKLLVADNNYVCYAGSDVSHCESLLKEIKEKGYDADYISGDLTNESVVRQLVSTCINIHGRIDGLFNVAGVSGRKFGDGPLHECTLEGWQTTMDINLTTQFQMCKYVLQQMLLQQPDEDGMRGVILNMSSVLAFSPEAKNFTAIAYAAGKGAIISMSKTAAAYYAKDKIRINVIAPGLALTKMSARASENETIIEFMKDKQPLAGTVMSAMDVAKAAIFLLGNQSLMITGETMVVDAGWNIS